MSSVLKGHSLECPAVYDRGLPMQTEVLPWWIQNNSTLAGKLLTVHTPLTR